jgi:hypothetical protein
MKTRNAYRRSSAFIGGHSVLFLLFDGAVASAQLGKRIALFIADCRRSVEN